MSDYITSLKSTLKNLEEGWGGDIAFIKPAKEETLYDFEKSINWNLPEVFRYFYLRETNGLIIDDKRIYSLYDKGQKKTWVENLTRMNNPNTSSWFKNRTNVFNSYLAIGNDNNIVFCLSKKYDFPNPSLYICKNPNSTTKVELDKLNLDLESLIKEMTKQTFDHEYFTKQKIIGNELKR